MDKQFVKYEPHFQQMVVDLLETGKIESISEARRKFNIGGSMTIQKWIKRSGKQDMLPKLKLRNISDQAELLKETDPELYDAIKKNIASEKIKS